MTNLTGTQKQINWAEKLRKEKIEEFNKFMKKLEKRNPKNYKKYTEKSKQLLEENPESSKADFWINYKYTSLINIIDVVEKYH
ncbi:MAG: hypothetical protein ACQESP_12475 [Candidatus Muiribacteriota bacterium]